MSIGTRNCLFSVKKRTNGQINDCWFLAFTNLGSYTPHVVAEIFLWSDVMPNEDGMLNRDAMIIQDRTEETRGVMVDTSDPCSEESNVFSRKSDENKHRQLLRKHKAWLELIRHEYPRPQDNYRIGVYIRYFNQTKHENYLDFHKKEYEDTIALCPRWELIDFYVDNGATAPNMENAPEWCRLLNDCFSGRVDLIVTQKVSNVSRKPEELAFVARLLACQEHPVGMYFINEELFTLASYYQNQMRDIDFLEPDMMNQHKQLTDGELDGTFNE